MERDLFWGSDSFVAPESAALLLELMASRLYGPGGDEFHGIVRGDLAKLEADLGRAIARPGVDRATRIHLQEMHQRAPDILDPKVPIAPTPDPEQPKYFPLR